MKYFAIGAAFAMTFALAACQPADEAVLATSEAPAPAVAQYDAATFFMTTSFLMADNVGFAFSASDGRILISSDETGTYNAYAVDPVSGAREALTDSTTAATAALSWFPNDDRVLVTFDGGGDELNHIYVRELDGRLTDITPGENVKADFLGFSPDGNDIWVASNARDAGAFDIYQYDTQSYESGFVFENTDALSIGAVSPDGRWLALVRNRTSADSDILLVDLAANNPEPALVTAHEGNIAYGAYTFTPDSSALIYATNEHGEFNQAWSHDLATGERSALVTADWDVSFVTYSPSGRYLVTGINADARTEVTITDLETGEALALPELPSGDLGSVRFSRDEGSIAFTINAATSPSNIHLVELASQTHTQLTQALNPAIDEADMVDAEVVRFASFDGVEIPGILYRPHGASADNPVPALVMVHGGPGGQSRIGYSAMIQHLVNHGYAVYAANNRGSSGYGKTFFHMDDRRHGEEDLRDIVSAGDYLRSLDWVRDDQVGVIGGSYGGFMTVAALAFHPDAFEVGIDIFGVTNWERTLASIPPWWESFREALYDEMGDPETDGERHRAISPLFHADTITKPLMVIQGANDPRVLQVESDEMVAAVRANGVPVEYVLFPDEGHGFRGRDNRITASEAYLSFLDTYLREGETAQ
ncbi:S9 family peptidase [Maricaulis salignorans]|uniref:Acyl-peptide hydrolase n=1 Tax=Maricaulis salignorans TaxID=144026 RepID=A0A1G9S2X5_9PROT|nr:S9 family peptidase [Maricaulis salignorans]SDM29816.1 Dipeptidyl aminopeptidase/acylaminoacyl peptidase [Maricaulis salignorans]